MTNAGWFEGLQRFADNDLPTTICRQRFARTTKIARGGGEISPRMRGGVTMTKHAEGAIVVLGFAV